VRITFLLPDIGGPIVGGVTTLASSLRDRYEVEVVGPDFGHGVAPMYRDSFPYVVVKTPHLYRLPDYFWERRKLGRAVSGGVVIAAKAFPTSLPVALGVKRQRGARVLLYLDEWDGAICRMMSRGERSARWLREFRHPMDPVHHAWVERLIPRCDGVLCASSFLARKFGGRIVHQGVDTEFFKPRPEAAAELRSRHQLEGLKLIVFGGYVRPHKGIEQVPEALSRLGREDVRFVVVGPSNEHVEALRRDPRHGRWVVALGAQPKERMPDFLSMADLVVLPSVDNLLARSQMPCKIFEAMAVARPIVATAVSDLPAALEGCGWVVPPGDVAALAEAMGHALSDPAEAARRGEAARGKCLHAFSMLRTGETLAEAIEAVLNRV
jgi:glycosyltransferase involved in cell wall biosynthesis